MHDIKGRRGGHCRQGANKKGSGAQERTNVKDKARTETVVAERKVHAHRTEKLAVVVWSDAAWTNRKKTCSQLLVSSQQLRQRESCSLEAVV